MNPEKIVADLKERLGARQSIAKLQGGSVIDKLEAQLDQEIDVRKQAELQKKLNEEKTNALIATGERSIYDESWYKQSVKELKSLSTEIEQLKAQRTDRQLIINIIQKREVEILDNYHEKAQEEFDNIKDWQKAFKIQMTQAEYTDPQIELLKRQDWDAKLNSLNEYELKNLVDDLSETTLSQYEANSLQTKVNGTDLETKVRLAIADRHIGTEYETTDAWLNTQSKLAFLKGAISTSRPYILNESADGSTELLTAKTLIDTALLGYEVSDTNQRDNYQF